MAESWQIVCANRRTCLPERTETSEKLCFVDVDNGAVEHRDFGEYDIPGATTWGKGALIDGGPRMLMYSHHYERPIGPDVPFYKTVTVRAWIYDANTFKLVPIDVYADAPYTYVSGMSVIAGEQRIIACLFEDLDVVLVTMNFEGGDRREIRKPVPGFCHTPTACPDGSRIATEFNLPHEGGRIFVMNVDGSDPIKFNGTIGQNQFMPIWSPNGDWISYVEFDHAVDPEHHQGSLWLARPDGSEFRCINSDRSFWLSAVNGGPDTYGSGSNYPVWSPDGNSIIYPRLIKGSVTAWPLKDPPDVDDHFGREFCPGRAVGGTELCRYDLKSEQEHVIVSEKPATWFFRVAYSPDGRHIAYCRSSVGEPSELWVAAADGRNRRFMSRGLDSLGVDHPTWARKQE